jgi:tetratricopeptide (TPR) repeat protein
VEFFNMAAYYCRLPFFSSFELNPGPQEVGPNAMRKINVRLLGILLLGSVVSGGLLYGMHEFQVRRNASVLLNEARSAKDRKDYRESIDFYERYIALIPASDTTPVAELAALQFDVGRLGQAFRNFEAVLRQDPHRSDIRRKLVDVALRMRREADARQHVDVLLAENPEDAELYDTLARCQIAAKEDEAAASSLERALQKDPKRLASYSRLASLLSGPLKNKSKALAILDDMVAKNSDDFHAYVLRGTHQLELSKVEPTRDNQSSAPEVRAGDELPEIPGPDAVAELPEKVAELLASVGRDARQALEMDGDDEQVISFAIRYLIAAGKSNEAAEQARRGLALHPQNAYMFSTLATVELRLGHRDEAISWLQKGLNAVPKQPYLLWNLANLYIDAGRLSDAEKCLVPLRTSGHPQPLLAFLDARLLVEQQQWFEASQRLQRIRSSLVPWPDIAKQADFRLGQCYEALGRFDLQLIAFRRAAGVDEHWIPARRGTARALLMTGKVDEALEEYQQIAILPGAPLDVLLQLARVRIMVNLRRNPAQRNWNAPRKLLDRIDEIDSKSPVTPVLRAEILVAEEENQKAEELLQAARTSSPEIVEFWLALASLAERREDWESAWQMLEGAQERKGDTVQIRLARAKYHVNLSRDKAGEFIRDLSKNAESFSAEDQTELYSGLASLLMAIGDFEESERLCRLVADQQPFNLRIRLILFDLALRAGKTPAINQVLDELKGIERSGPLWHYGTAVNLTLRAKAEEKPELYDEARKHLSEARVARPAWSRIPLLTAQICDVEGDEDTAISYYTQAINLGERSPGTISHTVSMLYQRRRFPEADRLIRRLQEQQSPFSNDLTRLAAEVSLRLNDTERALDLVTKAALKSTDPIEHIWAGRILSALEQNDDAEKSFRQAIELDETLPEAWVALIQHLGRTSQIQKAEIALEAAKQKIGSEEAPLALAVAMESIGRFEEAESRYMAAMAAAPEKIPVIRRLTDFLLRQSLVKKAEPLLTQVLTEAKGATDEDRTWARRNLALIFVARGTPEDAEKALSLVEENLKQQPKSETEIRAKAMIQAMSKDRSSQLQAAETLEKILANQKSRGSDGIAETQFALVQLYAGLRDVSKATSHLRTLMASHGDSPRYLTFYVQYLVGRNETTEADLWIPKLAEVAPNEQSTLALTTEVRYRQERYADVYEAIDKFVANPGLSDSERQSRTRYAASLLEIYSKRLSSKSNESTAESNSTNWATRFGKQADVLLRKYAEERPQEILALAAFLGRQGQHAESLDILDKDGSDARPEQIAAVTTALIASATASPGDYARAERLLRAELDKRDRPVTLILALADLLNWTDQFANAEQLYREILKTQERHPAALNNLALMLALHGRGENGSLALVDKAIQVLGPQSPLLDTRATINLLLGKPKEAAADIEKSLAARPSAASFFHQSLVEQRLGNRQAARDSLVKANELGLKMEELHPLEWPSYRQLQKELQ